MAIRIVLAVCIVLGCTLFGRALSNAARRRVAVLNRLIRGVKMVRIHITGMLEKVSDALKMSGCDVFIVIGYEMEKGKSAKEAWNAKSEDFMKRCSPLDSLTDKDVELLNDLFSNLGESSRREQEMFLESIIKGLCEQRDGAKVQLNEKEQLYVSVGFIIGLMLALVVI